MNTRGAKSVQSIMQNVLYEPPESLLYFAIFGSQVRGTEREDSDLDVMFVTAEDDSLPASTVRRAAKIPGGVKMVTILPHTPESMADDANVYGTVEYGVLRGDGSKVLYRSPEFHIQLGLEIDYGHSAEYWLKNAETYVFPVKDYSELLPGMTCFKAYLAVDSLLRASLMAVGTKFPFTHDLHVLYGMLPSERRPPVDIGVVMTIWNRYFAAGNKNGDWSLDDVRVAKETAKQAYEFTVGLVKGGTGHS